MKYVVSACLAGVACRYDGRAKPDDRVIELVRRGEAIAVCPEQLGGLSTPRPPAEKVNGRIVTKDGVDVTAEFERGADVALRLANEAGATHAILKSKSPSCGVGCIYDGTFSKVLVEGDGVFGALCRRQGIAVVTELEP